VNRAAFWLVVLAAGCDGVFKLTELPRPPDAAADVMVDASLCEYATLSPNADKDMDGVINAIDPCPTVALEGSHDEDGDSIVDACDPCPMTIVAGDDLDCDLLGAACDPDDTVPHAQTFFGFGDTKGLSVGAVVVANDRVTGPSGVKSGSVLSSSPVSPIGRYEIVGHIRQIDAVYRSISLDFVDSGAGATYECQLSMDSGFASIDIQRNNVSLALQMLGIRRPRRSSSSSWSTTTAPP
jgi:hypothetical protein